MPIYEYQCQGCHHEYDLIQKINEPSIERCPKCLENKAIRLVSAPSFQLKGTGWYATDYKDKDKPKPEKKAQDSPPTDTKSAEASKEASAVSNTKKGETD